MNADCYSFYIALSSRSLSEARDTACIHWQVPSVSDVGTNMQTDGVFSSLQ
jgi:hypothetical protein